MQPVDQLPTVPSAWHRRWRRRLAVGALRLSLFAAVWAGLVGGFAWLGGSEAGLRWAGARLTQASGGQLQIDGLGGRLLGDWHAQSLRWRDADQAIDIDALRVSWSPLALTRGELRLTRLEAAGVRLAFAAPGQDTPLPDQLGLPLAVQWGLGGLLDLLRGGGMDGAQSLRVAFMILLAAQVASFVPLARAGRYKPWQDG